MADLNTAKERFWSKVDIKGPDDCWNWLACSGYTEYGVFKFAGKTMHSHRISWELTNGTIKEGMMILHKCDNRKCCNPNHLYEGDHCNNVTDSMSRHPERIGKKKGKLLSGEIQLIRKLKIEKPNTINVYKKYIYSAVFVGKMFKVDNQTILNIWNSDKWLCREGYYI